LLKNGHLAAVLESRLVRRSAATPPRGFLRVRRSNHFWATWFCKSSGCPPGNRL